MYITPPNATGTLCVLDQMFQMLHGAYGDGVTDLKKEYGIDMAISKHEAVSVICHVWKEGPSCWASQQLRISAWKKCGIFERKVSVAYIPMENFMLAEKWKADELEWQTAQLAL